MANKKPRDPEQKFNWTLCQEEVLFRTLIEQLEAGKRADNGFKAEAWAAVVEAVQKEVQPPLIVQPRHYKNKFGWYKGMYKEWLLLKEQSGFGWDPETDRLTAAEYV
ncbi:hypothetical protein MMC14_003384 [Varicellaria rhodocarpa]|nr:hypothetical protein [Varicellaria rhodocarpa]